MKKESIFGIDFDGTCVKHAYPEIGGDIKAGCTLRRLINRGHKIILMTMRSGKYLDEAVNWFTENSIPLYGVNNNPEQSAWTNSPKIYANVYVDDAAFGVPLQYPREGRPHVDWGELELLLEEEKYLDESTDFGGFPDVRPDKYQVSLVNEAALTFYYSNVPTGDNRPPTLMMSRSWNQLIKQFDNFSEADAFTLSWGTIEILSKLIGKYPEIQTLQKEEYKAEVKEYLVQAMVLLQVLSGRVDPTKRIEYLVTEEVQKLAKHAIPAARKLQEMAGKSKGL